jgi:hypothetical protein
LEGSTGKSIIAISSVDMVRGRLAVDVGMRVTFVRPPEPAPDESELDGPSHRGQNRDMSGLNVMRQAQMIEEFTSARFQYVISA